jgi:hypothetical protein
MRISDNFKALLLALSMYLPTCAYVPGVVYVLLIIISILISKDFLLDYFKGIIKFKITDNNFTLLILFAFVGLVFRLLDFYNWESSVDIYSFVYLFPITYIVARSFDIYKVKVVTYLIYFILIESLISIIQYICGVSTFYFNLNTFREFENYDLLYYTRVFGLSSNSSGMSLKFFIGLLLLNLTNFGKLKHILIEIVLLISSIIAFGRITLIVIPIYYIFKAFRLFLKSKKIQQVVLVPFLLFVLFFAISPSWTRKQFTRNDMAVASSLPIAQTELNDSNSNIDSHQSDSIIKVNDQPNADINLTESLGVNKINMAGRNEIWNHYFEYGKANLFGNSFKKYLMKGTVHAHNSFLQIYASFGIIFSILLLLIYFRKINLDNYFIIIPILILAMGQYFVFWGISFFDIIFYYFLFFFKPKLNEK